MKQIQLEDLGNRETIRANAQRSEDVIKIAIDKVHVRKGFNVRTEYGDIPQLASSILENGQSTPGRVDALIDGTFLLTDGHRRFKALQLLKEQGHECLFKAIVNDRKITEEQRLIQIYTTQDNKKLEPLEVSELIRRMTNLGNNQAQIATKLGISAGYVSQMMALSRESTIVKEKISAGDLSASEAAKIRRAIPNTEERDEKIKSIKGQIKSDAVLGINSRSVKITKLAKCIVSRFSIDYHKLVELLEDNY